MNNRKLITDNRKPTQAVGIIGYGVIGQALEKVLLGARHAVSVFDKNMPTTNGAKPLALVASRSDVLFLCVPSAAVRDVVVAVRPFLTVRPNTIVVSLAKGMEGGTRMRMDEVLRDTLPRKHRFALLGGPLLAAELVRGLPGIAVVASADREARATVVKLFSGTAVRCEATSDVESVAVASVLKNIYALAVGVADGLGWGGNLTGWLVVQSEEEMSALGAMLGARQAVIRGMAGFGDFIATAFSSFSKNREAGEEFVRTGMCCLPSEGVHSLPLVLARAGKTRALSLPVLSALAAAVLGQKNVRFVFQKLVEQISPASRGKR